MSVLQFFRMKSFGLSKRIILFFLLAVLSFPAGLASAAMQSSSYVIHENVNHSFDGPVISAVSATASGLTATVTWTTNVEADSFVVYNTDSALTAATNKEQGLSIKNKTNHSVTLSGLAANTTYYYRAKSTRLNGGTTLSGATLSFVTGADPADEGEESTPPSAGGGVIIIDKTDTKAPEITNLQATPIDPVSARITWQTSEPATSFVEYGLTESFGRISGQWSSSTVHELVIDQLEAGKTYYYRALSSDSWGNLGRSAMASFTLAPAEPEEEEPEEEKPDEEPEEPEEPGVIEDIQNRAIEILRRIFPELAINQITQEDIDRIGTLNELSDLLPAPIIIGAPRIEAGATEVKISWATDIESNSLVAIASEERFRPGEAEPYSQVVGQSDEYTRSHEVSIYDLEPDTTYHFQLRSKPRLGPATFSRDYTFATELEGIEIVSFFSQVISGQEAVFRWVTNKESDTVLKYAPYHDNIVAADEQKVVKDAAPTVIHEIRLSDLEAGVIYDIELSSTDAEAKTAIETIDRFSTSEEDLPPEISHVKADSTVFLDQDNKTQTVISWLTNEPATTRLYYREGVHGDLGENAESISLTDNYTKEHVIVITKFKPGIVYSFQVESADSGGTAARSKVHTFMTAKQRESIIQIIIRIFEDTFGWAKKLM